MENDMKNSFKDSNTTGDSISVALYASKLYLFKPAELKQAGSEGGILMRGNYTNYLIAKRKKIFFEQCRQASEHIYISTFYTLDQNNNKEFFQRPHPANLIILRQEPGKLEIKYNEELCRVSDYTVLKYLEVPRYNLNVANNVILNTDLEVLYIGQSQKGITNRLMSHGTLQSILSDINYSSPSEDIFIIGVEIQRNDISKIKL